MGGEIDAASGPQSGEPANGAGHVSCGIHPIFTAERIRASPTLRRITAGLSELGVAVLATGSGSVSLGTLPVAHIAEEARVVPGDTPPGQGSFMPATLTPLDLDQLNAYAHPPAGTGRWRAFCSRFENGCSDHAYVWLARGTRERDARCFLSMIWPVLREDCLRELRSADGRVSDAALLWLIAAKSDAAALVANRHGLILRRNAAARQMMEEGRILARRPGGIHCADDLQTRRLRAAIAACAAGDPQAGETVLFIEPASGGPRVPVSLSRFVHEGTPTDLVTLFIPAPPDSRRVETLARKMGLTAAEARVAALMQLGLSNREAAEAAGLREQSFATYAKRVLNKLNVNSRAEMAQMLTWQAHGGRMS